MGPNCKCNNHHLWNTEKVSQKTKVTYGHVCWELPGSRPLSVGWNAYQTRQVVLNELSQQWRRICTHFRWKGMRKTGKHTPQQKGPTLPHFFIKRKQNSWFLCYILPLTFINHCAELTAYTYKKKPYGSLSSFAPSFKNSSSLSLNFVLRDALGSSTVIEIFITS